MNTFACQNCGQPYVANPPANGFPNVYLKPCQENQGNPDHNFKQFYECQNCDFRNELYWCSGDHGDDMVTSDYAVDRSELEGTKFTRRDHESRRGLGELIS